MVQLFGAIAYVFGFILQFWQNIFGNYGVAVIMFTITIKLLLLPLTIKQQKSMEKTQELQPKLNEIQEKYKDDKEKFTQEYQKFMAENKFNPFGGCLITILQMFILLGVFFVVAYPLKYMEKLDENQINTQLQEAILYQDFSGDEALFEKEAHDYVMKNSGENIVKSIIENKEASGDKEIYTLAYKNSDRYHELKIMNYSDKYDMNFLGINLGDVTANNMSDWKLWIFPILTTIFYYISMWMISRKQKKSQKKMKDANGNEIEMPNMMIMNFMMPLLSGWISYSVPQGMGLYWFSNSLLQIIIQLITDNVVKKKTTETDEKVLKPIEAIKEDEPISKTKQKKIEKNKKKK